MYFHCVLPSQIFYLQLHAQQWIGSGPVFFLSLIFLQKCLSCSDKAGNMFKHFTTRLNKAKRFSFDPTLMTSTVTDQAE